VVKKASKCFLLVDDMAQDPVVVSFYRSALICSAANYFEAVFKQISSQSAGLDTRRIIDACHTHLHKVTGTSACQIVHTVNAEIEKKWTDKGQVVFEMTFLRDCIKHILENPAMYATTVMKNVNINDSLKSSFAIVAKDLPSISNDADTVAKMKEIKQTFNRTAGTNDVVANNNTDDATFLKKQVEEVYQFVKANSHALAKLFQDHRSQESVTYKILEILDAVVFLYLSHTTPPKVKEKEKDKK